MFEVLISYMENVWDSACECKLYKKKYLKCNIIISYWKIKKQSMLM